MKKILLLLILMSFILTGCLNDNDGKAVIESLTIYSYDANTGIVDFNISLTNKGDETANNIKVKITIYEDEEYTKQIKVVTNDLGSLEAKKSKNYIVSTELDLGWFYYKTELTYDE
jgi:uncharacterized protein (TIGR02588 family)